MAKRGRKSSAIAVAVLPAVDPSEIESIARPEPPVGLDVSARDVWLEVVDNLPADWFEAVMLPVLEQYCGHVVEARRLNGLIVQAVDNDLDLEDYARLLSLRGNETRVILSLATKMRITAQSRINKRGNKVTSGDKPWAR